MAPTDDWIPASKAYPLLREIFRSQSAFRFHLTRRASNGMLEADAVRRSPVHRLIVNPRRLHAWARSEPRGHPGSSLEQAQ
jgi:hypothetical protein